MEGGPPVCEEVDPWKLKDVMDIGAPEEVCLGGVLQRLVGWGNWFGLALRLVGWLVGRLVGWLVGWLVVVVFWSFGWLVWGS